MSQISQSSEMEEFFGVLYELVSPMLGSENCVKCITQDGNVTFTSDVEHLLSSLDIENIAGELVIQALQSHKHTFGTGTKTLLFMMASLAKAVTHLHRLGIPSEKSLQVIHMTFADLSKDVEEISIMTQENLNLSSVVNCQETCTKTFVTEENYSRTAIPQPMTRFGAAHESAEIIFPSFGLEIPLFEFKESMHQEVLHNSTDNELQQHGSAPFSANTDPVYLKMSNLQDLSNKADDIEWFFDSSCSNHDYTTVTNDMHADDHACQSMPKFASKLHNNLTAVNIHSTVNTLKSSFASKSILGNVNCKHQNEILSKIGISSLKGDDQHDIDFENCFDETDRKQQVCEVNESILSDNVCKSDSVLYKNGISAHTCGSKSHEKVVFNMFDKQCLRDIAFNAVGTPQLFNSKKMYKTSSCIDEFNFSTSDIDISDSSKTHDNSLLISYTGCENQTTNACEMLNKSKQESCLCSAEVSNKLCETSCIATMSGTDLTCSAVARNKNIEQFRLSDKMSSQHITQDSEVKMLNSRLSFLGVNRSHVDVSTSSRHLQCTQNRTLQPEIIHNKVLVNEPEVNNVVWTTVFCENSSSNLPEGIHHSVDPEYTTYIRDDNCSASALTSNTRSNGQCDTRIDTKNDLQGNLCEEFSAETNSNGMINTASSAITETVNKVTDLSLEDQSSRNNIDKHNSKNKEICLDYLILQKKTQFKSSLAERVMTSSRHFYNSCKSTSDWTTSSQENCKQMLQSVNLPTADPSMLASNLNNMNSVRNLEYSSNKHLPVLVQNNSFSMPPFSDLKFENSGKIYDFHAKTNNLTEKLRTDHLEGSTCCDCVEAPYALSEETKQMCFSTKSLKVISYLHDCCGDVADAAMQLLQNQMKEKEKTRFNLDLVECLSIPSSTCSVGVVPGLAIPCDTLALEKLEIGGQQLLTLLINADLNANFHHKGYKPPFSKRTIIARPYNESQDSDERLWCVKALNIINHVRKYIVSK